MNQEQLLLSVFGNMSVEDLRKNFQERIDKAKTKDELAQALFAGFKVTQTVLNNEMSQTPKS